MANLIVVKWILVSGSILALANAAAKCSRSLDVISCEKADTGVIRRLSIYYRNDRSLAVKNSSIPTLEAGIFEGLKLLEKISLTTCRIRVIEHGAFRGLNLTHLNLARNFITDISGTLFADLKSLKFLDLSHNEISRLELNAGVGYSPELTYVDVSNNRLNELVLSGYFVDLETINFENNTLRKFDVDYVLRLPKIKEVFFGGNSFNKTYRNYLMFILICSNVTINFEDTLPDDEWKARNISTDGKAASNHSARSARNDIEKEFKLSPELIKSLNSSQLANLIDRILVLRNFTINERKMLEIDRKRVQDESRSVKNELTRIEQIGKRFKEINGLANEETVGEYVDKSCKSLPDDTWWRRFKKWKCKKLFNWVKRLISR